VIDTPPELRLQLVRERIPLVHAAVYTHAHADHIFGLDDLRVCGFKLDRPVTLYCEEIVERQIRQSFNYAFDDSIDPAHRFAIPRFAFERLTPEPFEVCGLRLTPIRLLHGRLPVFGFRIGDVAFCTDVSAIPDESWPQLEGLDTLVLGALRYRPHPTHFSVDQAVEVIERLRPRRAFLTHLSGDLEYEETNRKLPPGVELAYDGLRIAF
jgi:phosphoribosyl 1,2-cyclic phosphate phosphodiesterase